MQDLSLIEDVTLPDSYGEEHRLGDVWSRQPTVVAWLRHYG